MGRLEPVGRKNQNFCRPRRRRRRDLQEER